MKRYKPKKDKIKYERKKISKTRAPIPQEQVIPDKTKYNRKKQTNKKAIEKDIEND